MSFTEIEKKIPKGASMQTTKLNNSKCCSTTSMEFIFFSKIERKLFEIFVKLETFIPSRCGHT